MSARSEKQRILRLWMTATTATMMMSFLRTLTVSVKAYEPEQLVGKTAIAIVNLPPRKMMGIASEGMLISAVHEEDGHEGLNLLMVDNHIPAGAKLY